MTYQFTNDELFVHQKLAVVDFYHFTRYAYLRQFGSRWMRAPHHEVICAALERVFSGNCKRLIINIPPRYSKTRLCVSFIAWALGKAPWSNFILTSYSAELAEQNSWEAREMARSDWFPNIFPAVHIDNTSSARHKWNTLAGGGVYASSTKGSITGFGAGAMREGFGGCILIDDPIKPDEARSDNVRNGVIEWYKNTLQSRTNDPANTPIIVIMQRLHEEDLSGWLLGGGSGEAWEHLCMPALQADNTALWPEKHTLADLKRMQEAYPVTFPGQYQQRPTPPMGGMFKVDRVQWCESVLEAKFDVIQWVRAWDLAATAREDAAATAGVLMGKRRNGGIVIAGIERLQGSPDQVEAAIVGCAKRDRMTIGHHHISLPKDPGAAGNTAVFYLTQKLLGYNVYSSPESGSKLQRAEPFAAQMNVGNVTVVNGPWAMPLLDELRLFPFGKFMDRVDACSRAFAHLTEERMLDYSSIDMNELNRTVELASAGAFR